MASEAAKLLDELMGRNRNYAPTDKVRNPRWDDPEVCKYALCGFCPHDLFVNTRADLGVCEKIHDDELRKSYEKSSRHGKSGYEEDFLRFLQDLLSDVERRIKKGQSRLALNNAQASLSSGPQFAREEKISMLTEKINDLVQQAEELGCEGNVEQAQGVLKLCEKLKEERTQLENSNLNLLQQPKEMEVCTVCGAFLVINDAQQRVEEHLLGKQHMGYARLRVMLDELKINAHMLMREQGKEMEVCEICGSLLVVGDIQQRVNEHIMGKQHLGYARIRAAVDELKSKKQKKLHGEDPAEREARLNREREEHAKLKEERRRKEDEEEKKKKRSRSRSRSRRSRSRERKRRSRSKDRSKKRSRSRDRRSRHRSRSRDRHRSKRSHRSRSRDKRSSRDKDSSRRERSSRDRDRSSRDKDRASHDKDRTKDKSSRDKDRSSRDRDRSSRDRDRSSHDRDRSSRDRDRSSRGRDRSSRDRDRSSRERDKSSGDRDRSSYDREKSSSHDKGKTSDDRECSSKDRCEKEDNIQDMGKVEIEKEKGELGSDSNLHSSEDAVTDNQEESNAMEETMEVGETPEENTNVSTVEETMNEKHEENVENNDTN